MGGYICLKPIKLSGSDYLPGNTIPAEAVLPSREMTLKKNRCIADLPDEGSLGAAQLPKGEGFDNFPIEIKVNTSEGSKTVAVGSKSVAEAIAILQLSEKDAKAAVGKTEDGDVLTIVGAADHRKNVISAVKERHSILTEEAGDADGTDV